MPGRWPFTTPSAASIIRPPDRPAVIRSLQRPADTPRGTCLRVRVSACQSVHVSECPCVRVSACPCVRVSSCRRVRVSVCQSVRMSECPCVRVSTEKGFPVVVCSGFRATERPLCQERRRQGEFRSRTLGGHTVRQLPVWMFSTAGQRQELDQEQLWWNGGGKVAGLKPFPRAAPVKEGRAEESVCVC